MGRSFLILTCLLMFLPDESDAEVHLRLATTTSTENSGLLAVLHPVFEAKYGVTVDVIAVGTGKALRLGRNGDVDLVLVHAPEAEENFVNSGYGVERQPVMHNDFVFIGPVENPAGIKPTQSLRQVMRAIAGKNAVFISRGDDSGTHKKEMELWRAASINPAGGWYLSTGQGMGAVLQIADDKLAYTLADRGTYLAFKNKISLVIIYEGADELHNPYHVILVNPEKHPHVKLAPARLYSEFLRSAAGQKMIRDYTVNGEPLFYPDVITAE